MKKGWLGKIMASLLVVPYSIGAYEISTHKELTEIATERSTIGTGILFKKLGLPNVSITLPSEQEFDENDNDSINYFNNSKGDNKTVIELIKEGVDFEDTLNPTGELDILLGRLRVFNHFYDPQNFGRPLTISPVPGVTVQPGHASPSWILEDRGDLYGIGTTPLNGIGFHLKYTDLKYNVPQLFSFKEGLEYFYNSLVSDEKSTRDIFLGLTFQTLGHVVHHIQDMGQPQHVRNDRHLGTPSDAVIVIKENDFVEKYVEDNYSKGGNAKTHSFIDLIDQNVVYNNKSIMLPRARDYWDWGGDVSDRGIQRIGMAEYSGTNFVTDDTNFQEFDFPPSPHLEFPLPTVKTIEPVFTEFASVLDNCRSSELTYGGDRIVGQLAFVSTDVVDGMLDPNVQFSGHTQTNEKASTFSIWSEETFNIPDIHPDSGVGYTMNECVYDRRLDFVIPRAVAFSSGMIDYFFRGELEISPPDEGVYAIKDHHHDSEHFITLQLKGKTTVDGERFGFEKIRLMLKNTTPNIELPNHVPFSNGPISIPQNMFDGTLRAIVKYSLNNCFFENGNGDLRYDSLESMDSEYLNSELTDLKTPSLCTASNYFGSTSELDNSDLTLHLRRRAKEHISKSAIKYVGNEEEFEAVRKDQSMLVEFDFSGDPIPLNATDVRLQVVYRGKMGPQDESLLPEGAPTMVEPDAVVVGTINISEPSDVVVPNLTNYFLNMPAKNWISLDPISELDTNRPAEYTLNLDPSHLQPGNYKYYYYINDRDGLLQVDLTVPSRYELRKVVDSSGLNDGVISGVVDLQLFPQDADGNIVGYRLEDGSFVSGSSPYQLSLDTNTLADGSHTINTALRYQGKLIWFDTIFNVHNDVSNTPPAIGGISDVDQLVSAESVNSIEIPLSVIDIDSSLYSSNFTLSSVIEGLVNVNRFMEVRQDNLGVFTIHVFDKDEFDSAPINQSPPNIKFDSFSHLKVKVTVSDGVFENSETFTLRRVNPGLSSQGYFNPSTVSITTNQIQSIPITVTDILGNDLTAGGEFTISDDRNLPVYQKVFAELGVNTAKLEGVSTIESINLALATQWVQAGGVYANLADTDLLKKLIDERGIIDEMPADFTEAFSTFRPYENLAYKLVKKSNSDEHLLATITGLDVGEYVRFSFLGDLQENLVLEPFFEIDESTNLPIGSIEFLKNCSSIKPEIHQWDESIGKYQQRGSARKLGNIFSSTRDFGSLHCQNLMHSVGNLGLVDSRLWTINLEESALADKPLTQIPLNEIHVDYR